LALLSPDLITGDLRRRLLASESESNEEVNLTSSAPTRQARFRKLWIDIGADCGARISIVYVEPELQTLFAQNSSREKQVRKSDSALHR